MTFILPPQSDSDYPVRMLGAIQSACDAMSDGKQILFEKDLSDYFTAQELFHMLWDMQNRTEAPRGDDCLAPPDPLYHRAPVRKVVGKVLQGECPPSCENDEQRAEWFMGILNSCVLYEKFWTRTTAYVTSMKEIDLGVDIGGYSQPVTVLFDSEKTGQNARPIAERVVKKLLDAVTAHVEQYLRDVYTYPQSPAP
ncbi:MAG: hypothetical protein WC444_03420 [Candidatus Paceibacterota bacterium]